MWWTSILVCQIARQFLHWVTAFSQTHGLQLHDEVGIGEHALADEESAPSDGGDLERRGS